MADNDLNKQVDAIKRQGVDLVRELHARKLAIPAAVLLLAIVAAMVMLPKPSAPPPAPPTTAIAQPSDESGKVVAMQVSLVRPADLNDSAPLADSTDPFTGDVGYSCKDVDSGKPKLLDCRIADSIVRVVCPTEGGPAACTGSGSSGATGSASGGGASAGTGSGGSGTGSGSTGSAGSGDVPADGKIHTYVYHATVKLDSKTYKDQKGGSAFPTSAPLVSYLGVSADNSKEAIFLLANGVTMTGADLDTSFQAFILKKGGSVTLTDTNGESHKFTLKDLVRVRVS